MYHHRNKLRKLHVSIPTCKLAVIDIGMLEKFIDNINTVRGCRTPSCTGILVPLSIHTVGGSVDLTYSYNGCGQVVFCLGGIDFMM